MGRPKASPNDLILAVARHRDRAAFAALFDLFAPRLKSYLLRAGCDAPTAEELTQEAMVAVWRRADTFDPAQANAGTWIFTIVRNKRIDRIRRNRRPEIDPSDPALAIDPPAAPDRTIEANQTGERLRAAISQLPEEQGNLLRMAFFDDRPHSAIAEACELPLGTVKSRIRLALARLRKEFKDD